MREALAVPCLLRGRASHPVRRACVRSNRVRAFTISTFSKAMMSACLSGGRALRGLPLPI